MSLKNIRLGVISCDAPVLIPVVEEEEGFKEFYKYPAGIGRPTVSKLLDLLI